MAPNNKTPSKKSFEVPWGIVSGLIILSILTGLLAGNLNENIPILIVLVFAGLSILLMVILPPFVSKYFLACYIFLFVAAFDFVGYDPISTAPIKIYFADGILLFMLVVVFQLLFHRISIRDLKSPITLFIIINFLFGIMAVGIGFYVGNSTNNILGDFRRFFLYPLVALLPLSINIKRSELRRIFIVFCLTLLCICFVAYARVILNTSWDPEQFYATNQFRAIGYFSGILICIGIALVYAISINSHGYKKIALLTILFIFEAAIFASGYRLLWILGIFLPLFISYFSSRGIDKVFRILGIFIVLILFLVGLTYLVEAISPDVYTRLTNRIITIINDLDFRNNIRFYAWSTAWSMFTSSPIIGVGIGDQFEFLSLSSNGQYVISHLTTHNILVSLLYQTGILGVGLFLIIHGSFTYVILRGMSTLSSYIKVPLLGMLAGYFSALLMGMVQPLFESPGAIVLFYFFVGFILNIYRMFSSNVNE
jgi:O-antigen ligase